MNKTETQRILRIISAAYPNYKPQYDASLMKDVIDLWAVMLNDVPMEIVAEAVKKHIQSNNEFAPSVGQIRTMINDMIGDGEKPEAEAWNMVLLAIRNGTYGADEEFAKLPEDVQQAIGGSHYLHELALSEDVNWGVESSNFYRNLRTVRERRRNSENLPNKVQAQIDTLKKSLSVREIEDKQAVARLEQKERYDKMTQLTLQVMDQEEERERSEGARLLSDMLREKLGMKRTEPIEEEFDEMPYDDEDIFA